MKLHHVLIVATLSLSVLTGDTHAQDRMFGNGRFLKKMRDDIFGSKPDPKPTAYSKAATNKPKGFSLPGQGNRNVPTPALPSKGNRPTAIDSQATYKAMQSRTLPGSAKNSVNNNTQTNLPLVSTEVSSKVQAMDSVTRSAKKQTLAFGMLLETRGQNLVVTQIDPAGNATKSGVRKGDLIIGAGGLELGSMLEFNEITDVLKSGDQLEFVVSHGGKKDKMLILFGEAPDMTPKEVVQSNLDQYEIAPANTSMHSVIESNGPDRSASRKSTYQPSWKYNSQRRTSGQQIRAIEAASVRGETILNVPN